MVISVIRKWFICSIYFSFHACKNSYSHISTKQVTCLP